MRILVQQDGIHKTQDILLLAGDLTAWHAPQYKIKVALYKETLMTVRLFGWNDMDREEAAKVEKLFDDMDTDRVPPSPPPPPLTPAPLEPQLPYHSAVVGSRGGVQMGAQLAA
jgi:hypothetical protein